MCFAKQVLGCLQYEYIRRGVTVASCKAAAAPAVMEEAEDEKKQKCEAEEMRKLEFHWRAGREGASKH